MKKHIFMATAAIIALAMTACSADTGTADTTEENTVSVTESAAEESTTTTAEAVIDEETKSDTVVLSYEEYLNMSEEELSTVTLSDSEWDAVILEQQDKIIPEILSAVEKELFDYNSERMEFWHGESYSYTDMLSKYAETADTSLFGELNAITNVGIISINNKPGNQWVIVRDDMVGTTSTSWSFYDFMGVKVGGYSAVEDIVNSIGDEIQIFNGEDYVFVPSASYADLSIDRLKVYKEDDVVYAVVDYLPPRAPLMATDAFAFNQAGEDAVEFTVTDDMTSEEATITWLEYDGFFDGQVEIMKEGSAE